MCASFKNGIIVTSIYFLSIICKKTGLTFSNDPKGFFIYVANYAIAYNSLKWIMCQYYVLVYLMQGKRKIKLNLFYFEFNCHWYNFLIPLTDNRVSNHFSEVFPIQYTCTVTKPAKTTTSNKTFKHVLKFIEHILTLASSS